MPAYASDRLPHTWGNPSAEIVGYLLAFESLVPDAFRERVLGLALANLRHAPPPIHEFADLCFLRLARFADPELRAEILDKVGAGVLDNLQLDHARWHGGYFMKPYWFAMSPSEPLHDLLCHEIDACLDWEIETQEADGSFRLTWKIEGYGRKVWSSVWTLEVLKVLAAYGRIES
jgi:hypothetical protein